MRVELARLVLFIGMGVTFSNGASAFELASCQVEASEGVNAASRTLDCDKISLGYDPTPYRIRTEAIRDPMDDADAVLVIDYPPLDHLTVEIGDQTFATGSMLPYASRPIPARQFAFPVQFKDGQLREAIVVSARTSSSLQVPMSIKGRNEFLRQVRTEYLVFGLYYGAVTALLIYNLFIFLSVRERAYLYYVLYGCCYLVFQLTLNGISFEFLWPDHPSWSKPVFPIMIGQIFGFVFLFFDRFVGLPEHRRRLSALVRVLSALSFLMSTTVLFMPLKTSVAVTVAYSIMAAFVIALLALWVAIRGPVLARVFLFAWSTFLLGIVAIGLKNFGILPSSFVTDYSMQIGSATEMMLLSFGLGYRVRRSDQERLRAIRERSEIEQRSSEYRAVARTIQMLAHDVRKPFSVMQIGLGMLANARDPAGVKATIATLVPEIDKASRSVEGLIADVMEVGNPSTQMIREATDPEALLGATLGEVFRIHPQADVEIAYDLRHRNMVLVHGQKVGRVLANIVVNALQAMEPKGLLWFKTRQIDGFVEFCVGNSGSQIPPESMSKLFDAFFTSGKKGGTGLGLAIARKIVTEHGGRIWCESGPSPERPPGKVEIFFTLPIASERVTRSHAPLPVRSTDITKALARDYAIASVDAAELGLERDIIEVHRMRGQPLRLLIVDDEPAYRTALAALVAGTGGLDSVVDLTQASSTEDALSHAAVSTFDLVITDLDLGVGARDGLDLVCALRGETIHARMICVHSNRMSPSDYRSAIDGGADLFLPKPMGRMQLLKLLLQAARGALHSPGQGDALSGKKREVAVVEDNCFILEAWIKTLGKDAVVHPFDSPEELRTRLNEDVGFLDRLDVVVTDFRFDEVNVDGTDVARMVKETCPSLPVVLSSDDESAPEIASSAFDAVIPKMPVSFDELITLQAAQGPGPERSFSRAKIHKTPE